MSLPPPPSTTPSGRLMVVATLPAKPGKEERLGELIKVVQKLALSDEEPGTFTYRVTRRVDAQGKLLPVYVIIEEYAGAAGMQAHTSADAFQNLIKTAKEEDIFGGNVSVDYLDEC